MEMSVRVTNTVVKKIIGDQLGDPEIAARVLALRRGKLGLDQKQFAHLVGVKQPIVSQWETAKHRPSALALRKMGDLSGVDRAWWYKMAGEKEPKESSPIVEPITTVRRDSSALLDRALLIAVLETLDAELRRRKAKVSSGRFAELVLALYEDGLETGRLDASKARILAKTA